jgi:hypothetical protein
VRLAILGKLKKSTSSGIQTGDLPACKIMPQPTTLPRASLNVGNLQTNFLTPQNIFLFEMLLSARRSSLVMEPQVSLPSSEQSTIRTYPEPDKSSSHSLTTFISSVSCIFIASDYTHNF